MATTTADPLPPTSARPASRRGEPAWEIALLYPPQGSWRDDDYLALTNNTNRLIELARGCLEVLPMPTVLHQLIVKYLVSALDAFLAERAMAGRVLFAPLPVRLGAETYREPDVVYLKPERLRNLWQGRPQGADLVMEVVRPDPESQQRDVTIKRQEYADAGIPEYWMIDPQAERILVLTLDGSTYREHGSFDPGSQATSVLQPGFALAVADVFAVGQGD